MRSGSAHHVLGIRGEIKIHLGVDKGRGFIYQERVCFLGFNRSTPQGQREVFWKFPRLMFIFSHCVGP